MFNLFVKTNEVKSEQTSSGHVVSSKFKSSKVLRHWCSARQSEVQMRLRNNKRRKPGVLCASEKSQKIQKIYFKYFI